MEDLVVTQSDVAVAEPEAKEQVTQQSEAKPAEEKTAEEKQPEQTAEEKETAREKHNRRQWERLTRERAEFKAKAELLEQQFRSQQAPANDKDNRPARESFDNDEDYVDALTDYKVRQHMGTLQEKISETTRRSQVDAAWDTRVQAAEKTYPDFRQVIGGAEDVKISPELMDAMKSSDHGPDLAYYLAKNPDEAGRLVSLSPVAAAMELGRIASYIEYEKTQKSAEVSKAPPPARVPSGSTTKSGMKSLSEMSFDEYVKARQAAKKR